MLLTTSAGAWAQQVQKYIVRSWNGSQIVESEEEVLDPIFFKNSSTLTLGENDNERIWFVAPWENITVSRTITIKGVVHIVLGDKSTLTVKGGIRVEEQLGSYSPVGLSANDRSVLYMGGDSRLYYPAANVTIGACRAYFKLLNGITASDLPSGASIYLNFADESTGIKDAKVSKDSNSTSWYTLDGRRLSGKPTRRGIYIHGGKKKVVR